ncbi:Cytochrome c553 [Candidatus Nasuia deltocephalinicola]|uniref:Cytochrome c553 n=1 Tax=Candidatus Nasuia deltocephalincola TaxID=1160784 RepID=A0A7G6UHP5_9PROT|nr:Cytochrome c553 [Candidatus Nasuia deltocephalinicola]
MLKFLKVILNIIFYNFKKKFFLKKFNNFFYFKKILLCFNCHLNIKDYNFNLKNFFINPIIKNQNIKYLQYSLIFYKNFKRNSIYMSFISNYLNHLEIFYISLFFKCF